MVSTCFIVSVPLVVYSGLVLICISSHDFLYLIMLYTLYSKSIGSLYLSFF